MLLVISRLELKNVKLLTVFQEVVDEVVDEVDSKEEVVAEVAAEVAEVGIHYSGFKISNNHYITVTVF